MELQSRRGRESHLFQRLSRLSELLPAESDQKLYQMLISPCRDPENWLREAPKVSQNGSSNHWQRIPGLLQRMMYWDFVQYLPDEILAKVDRASMSVSLETRIPLLDHRIIEFAWSLPNHFRQRLGQGKWLLRQVLYQYVPRKLVQRPKQGFAAPIEEWLRTTLRPWAEELLSRTTLQQDGFFQESLVRKKWSEHLSGQRNWGRPLWNVLLFQAWMQAHRNGSTRVNDQGNGARLSQPQHIRLVENSPPVHDCENEKLPMSN
jgi:asparagine synthase (glutamine-hydrolysing)